MQTAVTADKKRWDVLIILRTVQYNTRHFNTVYNARSRSRFNKTKHLWYEGLQ